MNRSIVLVGAPCNLGIKPYESGGPRGLDRAPGVLRAAGVAALADGDLGDLPCGPYVDLREAAGRVRHQAEVESYVRALAERIQPVLQDGGFPLVLGGDCSVVLGGLLAMRRAGCTRPGLVYLDAHADFAAPSESRTGSVASMCLSFAIGRGDHPLASLAEGPALVEPGAVALVGRRDLDEPWYGHEALAHSGILDLLDHEARTAGYAALAGPILDRVAGATDGFWIHLDADVLTPSEVAAVDSPIPGGPTTAELAALLSVLLRHPKAAGLELTIYDPELDERRDSARHLAALLDLAIGAARRAGAA